jgi:hypothetical protein
MGDLPKPEQRLAALGKACRMRCGVRETPDMAKPPVAA